MANDWRETVDAVLELQADPELDTSPAPSMQWYPTQWMGDATVGLMGMLARGIHHHLLMTAWGGWSVDGQGVPCSLPDDEDLLRDLCRQPEGWTIAWGQVKRAWRLHEGRLWNLGLCRTYIVQMQTRRRKRDAAHARWSREHASASKTDALASSEPDNGPVLQCSSSSPSSSLSSSLSEEEKGKESARRPPPVDPGIQTVIDLYNDLRPGWCKTAKIASTSVKWSSGNRNLVKAALVNHELENILIALANVTRSGFHMGTREVNGSKAGPRLAPEHIFKRNSKIDSVSALLELGTPEAPRRVQFLN